MATYTNLNSLFKDIANSIRSKSGSSAAIVANNFPNAINALDIGTNTSSANATAADILAPKVAFGNAGKLVGTIATKTSANLSNSGATVTAEAGYYASAASKTIGSGTMTTSLSTHTNTAPSVTVSHSGNITTIGTTTKPAGTAGTNYYQIGFTNSVTAGNTNARSVANVTANGYLTNANNTASSWSNKTISATVTQPTTYYVNRATVGAGMSGINSEGLVTNASNNAVNASDKATQVITTATNSYYRVNVNATGTTTEGYTPGETASNNKPAVYIKKGSSTVSGTIYTGTTTLTVNNSNGYVTAPSVNKASNLTPTVVEGYITTGTQGSVTANFNASGKQLPVKAGDGSNYQNNLTVTPTTADQVVMNRGEFLTANHVVVKGMSGGTLTTEDSHVNDATVSASVDTYNSTAGTYPITGSGSITGIAYGNTKVNGYVDFSKNVNKSLSATATATGSVPKAGVTTTISGTVYRQPVLRYAPIIDANNHVNAAAGAFTTTAPDKNNFAVYVTLNAAANTATGNTALTLAAGYTDGTAANTTLSITGKTTGSRAIANTYIPIKVGELSVTTVTNTTQNAIPINNIQYVSSPTKSFLLSGNGVATANTIVGVVNEGYVTNRINNYFTSNINASALGTLGAITLHTSINGSTLKTPVINKVTITNTSTLLDAASGAATNSAPTSGVYVRVNSQKTSETAAVEIPLYTAGYFDGNFDHATITFDSKEAGAAASGDYYVPVTIGAKQVTQGTASGATVTGYVEINKAGWMNKENISISGTVASGSATTPATTVYTAAPTISINVNNGLITVPAKSGTNTAVKPTIVNGYITTGTAGTITATYNGTTLQLATKTGTGSNYQNNLYVSPYTNGTAQTIMNRNEYLVANHIIVNGVAATSRSPKDGGVNTVCSGLVTNASNHYVNTTDKISLVTAEANNRYKLTSVGNGNVSTGAGYVASGTTQSNDATNVYYVNKLVISAYSGTSKTQSKPTWSFNKTNGVVTASVAQTTQSIYRGISEGYQNVANNVAGTFTLGATSNTYNVYAQGIVTYNTTTQSLDMPAALIVVS